MDERRPGYYAIIPADVRYDDHLPANAKLMYGEISALIGKDGFCYAGNGYFADLYGLTERTVSKLISKLQDQNYVHLEFERDNTGQILSRKIYLKVSAPEEQPLEEKFHTPRRNLPEGIEKNFQYTNLSNTDICKENIKESPPQRPKRKRGSSKTDYDPTPTFAVFALENAGSREKADSLYVALVRFAEHRKAIKNPIPSEHSVTALCNKLNKYCPGDIPGMIDLLDTAVSSGWKTVYPSKNQSSASRQNTKEGRVYEQL